MKRLVTLTIVAFMAFAGTASAMSYDLTGGVYRPPGTRLVIASEPVPTEKQGQSCQVTVDLANNDSTRPGSDITIRSGLDSRLFPDTEAVAGDPGPVTFPMILGDTITATLTFGPNHEFDGLNYDNAAFSGAGTVTVGDCQTPPVVLPPPVVCMWNCGPTVPPAVTAASPVPASPSFTG